MKKVLYLGLRPPKLWKDQPVFPCPLIQITARSPSSFSAFFTKLANYTAFLFTSQTAVHLVAQNLTQKKRAWPTAHYFAVGEATGKTLQNSGIRPQISPIPTAEGLLLSLPKDLLIPSTHFCWPRAACARTVISDAFQSLPPSLDEYILYDTSPSLPKFPIPWDEIDRIVFTSPSTVSAFFQFFPNLTSGISLECIGPITKLALDRIQVDSFAAQTNLPE